MKKNELELIFDLAKALIGVDYSATNRKVGTAEGRESAWTTGTKKLALTNMSC